ncbi:hypothetical protein ACM26V_13555 [Salipaludibacillus sp. HK11]|uniref:hypothetical protein n=1 Tax=Salipaludibacillus sp. HK11 TaxID=3394320 RepID=UPI0039FDA66C
MQGAAFLEAIQTSSNQNLKQAYVLMTKTSMTKMITSKLMDTSDFILRKDKYDRYQHYIDEEVARVALFKEDLTFEVITLFAQRYETSLASIDTQQGLNEFGDNLLNKAVQSYSAMNKKFAGTTFEDVVQHFFNKMFEKIDKKYKDVSQKEKETLENEFQSFISELPQHQQEKLKKELDVSELSQQVINRIIATNGTVVLFSALVNTMGFSFYMGATSLLASGVSLLGLTLPFAAYTSMTSLIAVLANPIFFLAVIAASGFYVSKQRSKMQDMMTFLSVMQLFFSQDDNREEQICTFNQLMTRWKSKCNHYHHLLTEIQNKNSERLRITNDLNRSSEHKSALERKIQAAEGTIEAKHDHIATSLQNIKFDRLNEHLQLVGIVQQLQNIEEDIDSRSRKIIGSEGIFDKIKAGMLNSKNALLVKEREWKRQSLFTDLAKLIVLHDVPLFDTERQIIKDLKEENVQSGQELTATIRNIQYLKDQRSRLTKKLDGLENDTDDMLERYPGIDQANVEEGGERFAIH